jgi:hypothetical protein
MKTLEFFPGRCKRVRDKPLVLGLLKTITEAARRETALEAIRQAVVEFEKRAPKVPELLEEHGEEILGVYVLPAGPANRCKPPTCWSARIRN